MSKSPWQKFSEEKLQRSFERRLQRYEKHPSGCWIWQGSFDRNGYGRIGRGQKKHWAHRAIYEVTHGVTVPSDKVVCHSCDNPKCVNPAHLWLGTRTDNMLDKIQKGRCLKGEDCPTSKLTAAQVLRIKARDGRTQQEIADELGISRVTVSDIRRGKSWAWLTPIL